MRNGACLLYEMEMFLGCGVLFGGGVVTNMAFVETRPLHRQCRVALLSKHRLVLGRLQDRLAIIHTGRGRWVLDETKDINTENDNAHEALTQLVDRQTGTRVGHHQTTGRLQKEKSDATGAHEWLLQCKKGVVLISHICQQVSMTTSAGERGVRCD